MSTILQGVGLVAAVGVGVKNLKVGTPAAVMTFGSYAEFSLVYLFIIFSVDIYLKIGSFELPGYITITGP